eukprot:gnl/MRDRNA2_/MRDRNA2_76683_c0_seq1.p1 gnl/MRDRNA2_/MRDRNA2_76683_c0~~gnl/MRDRNA2_/MRDRNA2_76683_c0_seq1.p1  ORF type:complete len:539 (+),score=72.59 gnl/MRDRNA2_/MRDRNA2_76683_c0_seq1:133-1749(+)
MMNSKLQAESKVSLAFSEREDVRGTTKRRTTFRYQNSESLGAAHNRVTRRQVIQDKLNSRVAVEKEGCSFKVGGSSGVRNGIIERPDSSSSMTEVLRWHATQILSNQKFDAGIGIVILINSITIGIVSQWEVENMRNPPEEQRDLTAFEALEHVYLVIYTGELSMRFFAFGLHCLTSNWVKFDLVLVSLSAISSWIVGPVIAAQEDGASMEALAPLLVLRVMRLLRLARSVRLLVQFKTLWMLVRGLLSSAGTMLYTFALMMLILYVFACLGVELITKDSVLRNDEEAGPIVEQYFSGVVVTMVTLIQFVTMDSIGAIYSPIVFKVPFLIMYFVVFLIVVSISLMNLVTAVIVEGAIEQGKQDKDVQKAYDRKRIMKLIPTIQRVFLELDQDENGTVTLDEMLEAGADTVAELHGIMATDEVAELFELLDNDGSGEVSIDEFCDGLTRLHNCDSQSIEFIRLRKLIQMAKRDTQDVSTRVGNLEQTMQRMDKNLQLLVHNIGADSDSVPDKLEPKSPYFSPDVTASGGTANGVVGVEI